MASGPPFPLGVCPVVSLALERLENLAERAFMFKLLLTLVLSFRDPPNFPRWWLWVKAMSSG